MDIVVTFPINESREEKIFLIKKCKKEGIRTFRLNLAKIENLDCGDGIEECVELIRNNIEDSNIIFDIPYPGNYPRIFMEKNIYMYQGEDIIIYAENVAKEPYINVKDLSIYFKKGKIYRYNNGLSSLRVLEVEKTKICFRVESGKVKFLTSKSISAERRISSSIKNIRKYIIQLSPDKLWCSFVETLEDLDELWRIYRDSDVNKIEIGCKIETEKSCKNIKQFIRSSDEIVIARGDLGINLSPFDFYKKQKEIVQDCIAMGTPVYIATDILRSMGKSEVPNRAELTDIGWIIEQNVNGIMLNVSSLYSENFGKTVGLIRSFI